eukprot:TRINITY_DN8676_c0_g1_i1.p1 TRINITY_DN8676_c0_g1~~TRINITY_DN8676_c0_g1_i1.p1  ORF type:complete len:568 (-),score=141.85 TRINITY_DN8676_c0_g1_i1:186-1889(-)
MANPPLAILREFHRSRRPVRLENDTFYFDSVSFPKTAVTNFKSVKGTGAPYPLEAVWFFLQRADAKYADYFKEAKDKRFPTVSLVDKKELLSFMAGEIETCVNLTAGAAGLPVHASVLAGAQPEAPASDMNDRAAASSSSSTAEEPAPKRQRLDDTVAFTPDVEEAKRQLALRLQEPKVKASVVVEARPIKDLGSGLTAEKIKELKQKRQLQKRTAIREDDEDDLLENKPKQDAARFISADQAVTKEIIARERTSRALKGIQPRIAAMRTNKRPFTKVLEIVHSVMREERKLQPHQHSAAPSPAAAPEQRKRTYDRYNQQTRDADKIGASEEVLLPTEFSGSFLQLQAPKPAPAPVPITAPSPSPVAAPVQKPRPTPPKAPVRPVITPVKVPEKPIRTAVPIIIVPAAVTSCVMLLNALEFLTGTQFAHVSDKTKAGCRKPPFLDIVRIKNGRELRYKIVDQVNKMTPADWKHVVAVFAAGPEWQFKNWFWPTPVDVFSKAMGVFVHYEEDKVPETIKSWNVKVLTVSRLAVKQHLAQNAQIDFWTQLDIFMRQRKMDQYFADDYFF